MTELSSVNELELSFFPHDSDQKLFQEVVSCEESEINPTEGEEIDAIAEEHKNKIMSSVGEEVKAIAEDQEDEVIAAEGDKVEVNPEDQVIHHMPLMTFFQLIVYRDLAQPKKKWAICLG